VDTNVILARFAPRDPLRAAAKTFFDHKGDRIVSPISLFELGAVLSRGSVSFDTPAFLAKETDSRRVLALTEFMVESLGLRVESVMATSKQHVARSMLSMPMEYSEALNFAGMLKMRALDLLHVVYASMISRLRTRIDRLVTSDQGILEHGSTIQKLFGFQAVHPSDTAR
jgi:predicted nucleic acid-binding protein